VTPDLGVVVGKVVIALGPAFACGFAVQRLMGIFDPLLDRWKDKTAKTLVLGLLSLGLGWWLACAAGLQVLHHLGATTVSHQLDCFVTGVVISGGTEGFNTILKFMGYAKEAKHADAAKKIAGV